jgi:flavin-dependent dehydrogenase
VEKRSNLHKLANHKYGTFGETISKFSLHPYVTKRFSKFGFYGPSKSTTRAYKDGAFVVVDMNQFAKQLNLNCEVLTAYTVKKVTKKTGILINDEYQAKIVVDCSGDQQIISQKLGLLQKNPIHMFSTSFELENCKIPQNRIKEMWFMVDLNYSNVGLWFYPYSKTACQIGHTDFYSKKFPLIRGQRGSLPAYIRRINPYSKWLKSGTIKETVRKTGPTTTLSTCYANNFLSCGDASGAGTPIVGEGFRIALEMAASANKVILDAFKKNNFSSKILKQHAKNFDKTIGKYYPWSRLLRFIILNCFTNKEYDVFAENLERLSAEKYYLAIKSQITAGMLLKTLNWEITSGIVKNILSRMLGRTLNCRVTT